MVTITVDTAQFYNNLTAYRRQVPYALARALNKTADYIQAAEINSIQTVFDRPTPFTQKSVVRPRAFWATKSNLSTRVMARDDGSVSPNKYLKPQVSGGQRAQKRSEVAIGRYLGKQVYVAPAKGKLNQYGNIRAGELQKVLASLGVSEYAKTAVESKKRGRTLKERGIVYFVGRPGGGRLPYGVWMRRERKLEPVLLIIAAPSYKPRFPFFEIAQQVAQESINTTFVEEMNNAVATARDAR